MKNVFSSSDNLLIVALDHIPLGVMQGWKNVRSTLEIIVNGNPDYIVLNFGILKLFKDFLQENTKTILRLDGSPSYLVEDWQKASRLDLLYSVDDALRIGADAVIVNIIVGGSVEMSSIIAASKIAGDCLERDLPLIISAIPSTELKDHNNLEYARFASRLAAEIGADVVNTYFSGTPDQLASLISVCPAPVVLAGGSSKSDEDTIRKAHMAVGAGCRGICFGRSIWQSMSPDKVMKALRSVLNDPSSLDKALSIL